MNFTDVIKDLVKMEGLCLQSIRPGAEIVIEKVDIDQKKITIRNSAGKVQNRYFAELERIWDALLSNTVIRVEEVLNGSGSSRNQPETIFANLPYVEWLKISNKKHIAYVRKPTHSFGTIRQMDSLDVDRLLSQGPDVDAEAFLLIVSENISATAASISSCIGVAPNAIAVGVYEYITNSNRLVLVSSQHSNLKCGVYYNLPVSPHYPCDQTISLLGKQWGIYIAGDLKLISQV